MQHSEWDGYAYSLSAHAMSRTSCTWTWTDFSYRLLIGLSSWQLSLLLHLSRHRTMTLTLERTLCRHPIQLFMSRLAITCFTPWLFWWTSFVLDSTGSCSETSSKKFTEVMRNMDGVVQCILRWYTQSPPARPSSTFSAQTASYEKKIGNSLHTSQSYTEASSGHFI